ncbi:flagellar biosynthesis, cell-distal portion of basal-body rod [Klebsiella pneumoniae]|nr:flagellar biosynthesis, cell-distal portion of basal-body rod [Klebsiella pneumoniae]
MSNLPETPSWESGIHQLEEADRAKAGPGGVLNVQANQLANRTRWLKALVESAQDYREYTFYKSESDPDGTIAGLANTPAGKMFRVAQGLSDDLAFIYYLNDSGTALALTVLLGRGAIINNVREYPALSLAQNDVAAGNILEGAKCRVTNSSDYVLADEYINNGGTLEPTGRKMPSNDIIGILETIIQQMQRQSLYRDGVSGFSVPVLSADRYVVGFKDDGSLAVGGVEIPSFDNIPPRDAPLCIPIVDSTLDGFVGIGFNPKTGLTFALLDDDSVAYIADKIGGGGTTVPDIRGEWGARVFNPRHYIGDEYNTASVLDKGSRTFDARQIVEGVQDTLVMAAPTVTAIRIALVYGQSNAGLGGSTGRVVNSAPWSFSTWGFAGVNGSSQQGTVPMSASSLTDFLPALDYSAAQSPAICSAYGITQRNAELGRDDPGYIAATAWHGSQPISSFYPNAQSGYWNYENAVTFLQRSVEIAAQYGRTAILDVMQWIQGEAGPTGRDNYATQLDDLFTTILPGFKAATGQADNVQVAIWQTNMSKAASGENYASQGQWDVANNRADCFLAGPMYQFKLGDEPGTGPSTVHTGPEGRLMLGETYADVYSSIVDKGAWNPVQPVSAVLSGNVVDINFEGTPLDAFGAKLAIDSDWVPDTLNHGFTFPGATITAVEITGAKTVRLTLSAVPAVSNRTLRYAIDAFDDVTYWPTRRGNLMVETDRKSGNDSNLLIVFYVQIMPDDLVMQLHRF